MSSVPRIVLCADDYGLAPGIGRSVRELLALGRLSAVSCMTVGRFWPEEARQLSEVAAEAEVGLHLTLTDQKPLGSLPRTAPSGRLPAFGAMLRGAYLGRLERDELRDEMRRQLDAFTAGYGRAPDFVDGHHHVHQLPGVRELVADLFAERLTGAPRYVRTCAEPLTAILRRRSAVLRAGAFAWPGRGLRHLLERRGIPTNDGYAGAYDFSGRVPYAEIFDRFLVGAREGMLVNCHPGFVDPPLAESDSLTTQREVEHRFFSGPDFPGILERHGVALRRSGRC